MRDPRLTTYARAMRRQPTPAEQSLWFAVRARRFEGVKFRRQKVVGRYIADFAARDPMLVIEIDGDTHVSQEDYDAVRTAYLEASGYRVIRFTNADVLGNLDGVLSALADVLPLSQPSPLKGRGL